MYRPVAHIDVAPVTVLDVETICGKRWKESKVTTDYAVCLEGVLIATRMGPNKSVNELLNMEAKRKAAYRMAEKKWSWCPICTDEDKIALYTMDFLDV